MPLVYAERFAQSFWYMLASRLYTDGILPIYRWYIAIYMHIVFAVARRESLIAGEWADELYRYVAGACKNKKHFVHAINGTSDHIHILISMHPSESVSELVQSLKIQSSKWINEKYMHGEFSWQRDERKKAATNWGQAMLEREKGHAFSVGSGRGRYWQRPLPIMAAGGKNNGSVR